MNSLSPIITILSHHGFCCICQHWETQIDILLLHKYNLCGFYVFPLPLMSSVSSRYSSGILYFFLYNFIRLIRSDKCPRMFIDYSLVLFGPWKFLPFLIFHDFACLEKYWPGACRMSSSKALSADFLLGGGLGKLWLMNAKLQLIGVRSSCAIHGTMTLYSNITLYTQKGYLRLLF